MVAVECVLAGNKQLDDLITLSGTYVPLNTFDDRNTVVKNTCHWLCFGRNRAQFDKYVQVTNNNSHSLKN